MSKIALPALQEVASEASLAGQRDYLWLLRAQLAFPLAASVAALLWPTRDGAVAISILFVLGLASTIAMQLWRPERRWFDGRVIAESIKTIAWRYAMNVSPYATDITDNQAHDRIERRVAEVLKERPAMAPRIATVATGPLVTDGMTAVRNLPWTERRDIYVHERLDDQLKWYQQRGHENDASATLWLTAVALLQILGLVLAVLLAGGVITINPFGVVSVAITAALAWLQAKRHQDLAGSYGFAALELNTLHDRVERAKTEDNFMRLVEESEEAMSREHTAWAARRL